VLFRQLVQLALFHRKYEIHNRFLFQTGSENRGSGDESNKTEFHDDVGVVNYNPRTGLLWVTIIYNTNHLFIAASFSLVLSTNESNTKVVSVSFATFINTFWKLASSVFLILSLLCLAIRCKMEIE
jgi:hypothetical protein